MQVKRPLLEELEPRVLLSADGLGGFDPGLQEAEQLVLPAIEAYVTSVTESSHPEYNASKTLAVAAAEEATRRELVKVLKQCDELVRRIAKSLCGSTAA